MYRLTRVLTYSLFVILLSCTPNEQRESESDKKRPFRVLLINDDGYDSMGIQELYKNLSAKNYDVWMVAPMENQSGSGTSIKIKSRGSELVKYSENKYALDGTPVDCVSIAITLLMNEVPDLVISGINDGPNFGSMQINSGTVGGALKALGYGIPSIAVSLAYLGEGNFHIYMSEAVSYTVSLVEKLETLWKDGEEMLPSGTGLNINYPAVESSVLKGELILKNPEIDKDLFSYTYGDDGFVYRTFNQEVIKLSSSGAFASRKGYITISLLEGKWKTAEEYQKHLETLISTDK